MTEVERFILENQEIIMLALNKLLIPHCKGMLDVNGETRTAVKLINQYHETRKFLGKEE